MQIAFGILAGTSISFDAAPDLRSFYKAANSVLNVLNKPKEVVHMKLRFTNCISVMTYGCDIKEYSSKEMLEAQ
jgi:hypothetical protein